MKRKDEIRDIYQSESHDLEKDFTPQVAQEILEQRQRELQRSRLTSIFFGGTTLLVLLSVFFFVIREQFTERRAEEIETKDIAFVPRYDLPTEETWVMDYQRISNQVDHDRLEGTTPLSTKWIKYAAYHIIMGQQALAIQEPDTALEHFETVAKIYPEILGLHRSIGTLFIQRKEFDKAIDHLERALQEDEKFDVINYLGTAYLETQQYELAEKNLRRALELKPESTTSHLNIALLYRKMGKEDEAIFHFEKYLDMNPEDVDVLQNYALYLTKLERWKEAAAFLTQLTQTITDVPPIYFLLAQVEVQNNEPTRALSALRQGCQLVDPSLALTWISHEELDGIRDLPEFKKLMDQLEIDSVSLNRAQ